ncbi:hypothetical protein [Flexithrix dorotheae]|uniref:hypothetical protein n=1 Tax=Flexithrix dorotheae TaxID=70993 RepID=UPI0003702179|nr:hypothetical protein [Flexithrix dorotheae]
MKDYRFLLIVFIFLISETSCKIETDKNIDVEKVKQEMADRKFKRLTDAQIVQGAYDKAVELRKSALKDLKLDTLLCGKTDFSALSAKEKIFIEKIEVSCEENPFRDSKGKQVWEAYHYNIQNGLPLKDNIQKLEDGELVYSFPFSFEKSENDSIIHQLGLLNIWINKKELIRNL